MIEPVTRAITIRQPWAFCIAHGTKRIENRGWEPPEAAGLRIAIHAGKSIIRGDYYEALLKGQSLDCRALLTGVIVAVATIEEVVTESGDLWFIGPKGWVLRDVVPLQETIEVRGAQGLWKLPLRAVHHIGKELA